MNEYNANAEFGYAIYLNECVSYDKVFSAVMKFITMKSAICPLGKLSKPPRHLIND